MIKTNNKYLAWLLIKLTGVKPKRYLFHFELEIYETDVVDQTYVRKWIAELDLAVAEEKARLAKEWNL